MNGLTLVQCGAELVLPVASQPNSLEYLAVAPALLNMLLSGAASSAFSQKYTRQGGKRYHHSFSQTVLRHGAGLYPVSRVPAGEIESAQVGQLRVVFQQPRSRLARERPPAPIIEADAYAALQQLDLLWEEPFPAEQARVVALLIKRVDAKLAKFKECLVHMTSCASRSSPNIDKAILDGRQGPM